MKSGLEILIAVVSQVLWFTGCLWVITTAHTYVPYRLELLVNFAGSVMYIAGVLLLARFSYIRLMAKLNAEEQ